MVIKGNGIKPGVGPLCVKLLRCWAHRSSVGHCVSDMASVLDQLGHPLEQPQGAALEVLLRDHSKVHS
nr:hypothetical protein [Tanacetum cinerariifolium]